MPDQDELRRRIRAARELAGVSQQEMNEAGAKRGLPKNTLGKVERGDLTVRHVHLAMLCEILGVPMSWFNNPIVTSTEPGQLERIERKVDELLRRTATAKLEPPDTGPGGDDGIPTDLPGGPDSPQAPPSEGEDDSEAAG